MVFGLWKSLSSGSRFSLGPRCLSALSGQCYQSVSGARYIKAYFIGNRARAPAPALSPATHTRANAPRSRDEREQRRQTRDRLRERESLAHVSVPLTCVYLSGPRLSPPRPSPDPGPRVERAERRPSRWRAGANKATAHRHLTCSALRTMPTALLAVGIFKLQSNVKYFVYLKEIRITVEARGKVRLYVLKRTLEAYCKVGGLKGVGTPAIACETSLEVNNKSLVFRSVCSVK